MFVILEVWPINSRKAFSSLADIMYILPSDEPAAKYDLSILNSGIGIKTDITEVKNLYSLTFSLFFDVISQTLIVLSEPAVKKRHLLYRVNWVMHVIYVLRP